MDRKSELASCGTRQESHQGPKRNVRLCGDSPMSDLVSDFVPNGDEIAPKRSAGRERGSRRSVSIAPTLKAAGRGTDCSRETG
jgi:hypothetical protein